MGRPEAEVRFAAGLRVFLAPRLRGGRVRVACACGRIYWRGAHSKRLKPIVESAIRAAAAAHPTGR